MQQPDTPHPPARLKLTGDRAQVARLEPWLSELATAWKLPARTRYALDLVLTEAVTNVMDHSFRADGADPQMLGELEIICTLRGGHLIAELIDGGVAFDPTSRGPLALPSRLEDARPGGLGVHLMQRYTTSLEYVREQDKNVLRMTLQITADAPPS